MRLTPKSTIGTFENIFFQIRNFGTYHPYLSFTLLLAAIAALFAVLRNGTTIRKSLGQTNGGYFHLDGREGLLGGKAD